MRSACGRMASQRARLKTGVGAAERGNKVVLEGSDGALCGVAAMDVRGAELEVDVFGIEEVDQRARGLVVQLLETGSESAGFQNLVGAPIC